MQCNKWQEWEKKTFKSSFKILPANGTSSENGVHVNMVTFFFVLSMKKLVFLAILKCRGVYTLIIYIRSISVAGNRCS